MFRRRSSFSRSRRQNIVSKLRCLCYLPRMIPFRKMARVRQKFLASKPLDIRAVLEKEFAPLLPQIEAGATVAVGAGSRGISNIATIVRATLDILRAAAARPFVFPAMGSHGGATPEGQTE